MRLQKDRYTVLFTALAFSLIILTGIIHWYDYPDFYLGFSVGATIVSFVMALYSVGDPYFKKEKKNGEQE